MRRWGVKVWLGAIVTGIFAICAEGPLKKEFGDEKVILGIIVIDSLLNSGVNSQATSLLSRRVDKGPPPRDPQSYTCFTQKCTTPGKYTGSYHTTGDPARAGPGCG